MAVTSKEILDMHMSNIMRELVQSNLARVVIGDKIKVVPSMRNRDMVLEKVGDDEFVMVKG